jgi:hypothetical protein
MASQFILHIYIAAPGTPYLKAGEPPTTSGPGHMWYAVQQHGGPLLSFGFAPIAHGNPHGPGRVVRDDVECYKNPLYIRSMEINKAHFDALFDFGGSPEKNGFSLFYKDIRNNCVDFTWNALKKSKVSNHWGIYEGEFKPTRNIGPVKWIANIVPKSPFNLEKSNPMPSQTPLQFLLTQNKANTNLKTA